VDHARFTTNWTVQRVQLRFPDEAFARAFPMCYREQSQTTIESSAFLSIPQLGQAAPEDFVTYLMVTAEVGLPDAV